MPAGWVGKPEENRTELMMMMMMMRESKEGREKRTKTDGCTCTLV